MPGAGYYHYILDDGPLAAIPPGGTEYHWYDGVGHVGDALSGAAYYRDTLVLDYYGYPGPFREMAGSDSWGVAGGGQIINAAFVAQWDGVLLWNINGGGVNFRYDPGSRPTLRDNSQGWSVTLPDGSRPAMAPNPSFPASGARDLLVSPKTGAGSVSLSTPERKATGYTVLARRYYFIPAPTVSGAYYQVQRDYYTGQGVDTNNLDATVSNPAAGYEGAAGPVFTYGFEWELKPGPCCSVFITVTPGLPDSGGSFSASDASYHYGGPLFEYMVPFTPNPGVNGGDVPSPATGGVWADALFIGPTPGDVGHPSHVPMPGGAFAVRPCPPGSSDVLVRPRSFFLDSYGAYRVYYFCAPMWGGTKSVRVTSCTQPGIPPGPTAAGPPSGAGYCQDANRRPTFFDPSGPSLLTTTDAGHTYQPSPVPGAAGADGSLFIGRGTNSRRALWTSAPAPDSSGGYYAAFRTVAGAGDPEGGGWGQPETVTGLTGAFPACAQHPNDTDRVVMIYLSGGALLAAASYDRGRTWAALGQGGAAGNPGVVDTGLDFSASGRAGLCWLGDGSLLCAYPKGAALVSSYSADGGLTWAAAGPVGATAPFAGLSMACVDGAACLLCSRSLYSSGDRGATWAKAAGTAPGSVVTALGLLRESSRLLLGTASHTDDAGATWQPN